MQPKEIFKILLYMEIIL